MRLEEIDEKATVTLSYKEYCELKEAIKMTTHWLWKLRNKEELTDEERDELYDFMFKYLKCL